MRMLSVMAASAMRKPAETLGPSAGAATRVMMKDIPHSADSASSWKKYFACKGTRADRAGYSFGALSACRAWRKGAWPASKGSNRSTKSAKASRPRALSSAMD